MTKEDQQLFNERAERLELYRVKVESLESEISDLRSRYDKAELDSARLNWVFPILSLAKGPCDERAMKIAGALMIGKSGREALDMAMGSDNG